MRRHIGTTYLLGLVVAACASAPPCAANAQTNDEDCPPEMRGTSSSGNNAKASRMPARARALFQSIPIEDPSGKAMQSFHAALKAAEERKGQARVVVYGASHVAADVYTDVLRTRLQARFGEAGVGFALPAKPTPHYRNAGMFFENSSNWQGVRVLAGEPVEDFYGLAGMYVVPANKRPARSEFKSRPHDGVTAASSIYELYYWKQPDGGHFKLTVDGRTKEYSAASKTRGPAYEQIVVPDGAHKVELATKGDGPVRIFGMSMERDKPGVILDTLGIPGARAKTHLMWDDALYREHLARRKPDLIILAYGTNESGDSGQPIDEYAAELRKVVGRVRETVAKASCLLIGPSDRPHKTESGSFTDRPRTAQVIEVQRDVAAEFGCGFFDLVAFMGGPMSMVDWCDGEPPLGASDHVHFTARGYEALGNVLHDALLIGYQAPAPVVFGPRPIAPPGSTVSELNHDAREPNDSDSRSKVGREAPGKSRKKTRER